MVPLGFYCDTPYKGVSWFSITVNNEVEIGGQICWMLVRAIVRLIELNAFEASTSRSSSVASSSKQVQSVEYVSSGVQ